MQRREGLRRWGTRFDCEMAFVRRASPDGMGGGLARGGFALEAETFLPCDWMVKGVREAAGAVT